VAAIERLQEIERLRSQKLPFTIAVLIEGLSMQVRKIIAGCVTLVVVSLTSGCGDAGLVVVQPNEAFIEQLKVEEEKEKSGSMTRKQ